jgi:hypothetical protein
MLCIIKMLQPYVGNFTLAGSRLDKSLNVNSLSRVCHKRLRGLTPGAFGLESCGRWMSLTFYVHVSVDTYLGYIYASIHTGKATKHVIAWLPLPPWVNCNSSKPTMALQIFQQFCETYQIHHTTSIPYTPQGQAIVECAHATLKMQLQKLKGVDEVLPPVSQLHKALYTFNFLNCPERGLTPTERHWQPQKLIVNPQVSWKNVLTGKCHGPSPVLMWGQGHVCFS